LHRKRHVGLGRGNAQLGKQRNQLGVGAFVEHQKAGVHAMRHRACGARQGDIHGVGMAAEVVARLEQGQCGLPAQAVGSGQTCDSGTDDCNFHNEVTVRCIL
jgi:hypothetical protein